MIGLPEQSWTYEEAYAQQQRTISRNPALARSPKSPLYQWGALRTLRWYEARIARHPGDSVLLMDAVGVCCKHGIPIPDRIAKAFVQILDRVKNYEVNSWDGALGKPFPGKHLDSLRERSRGYEIWERITELRSKPNPPALDRAFYTQVAGEMGIGGSRLCRELYEEWREIAVVFPSLRDRQRRATSDAEAKEAKRKFKKEHPPDISRLGQPEGN